MNTKLLSIPLVAAALAMPAHADEPQPEPPKKKVYEMMSPVIPPPPSEKLPPPLHVAGNEIHTPDGKPIWLQGLCVDSLQWSGVGERVVQSIIVAIEDWKANVIRLPIQMREDYWFGNGEWQNDGGALYRQIVDSCVNATAARGAYIVIDLHKFRAPTEDDVTFWKDVATRYKNHPAVIFELFNEPHDITWEVWRDGGTVTDKVAPKEGVAKENEVALKTFKAVGMQELVDIVRATGAKNMLVVGGLDWSYDLRGILNGYALDDRGGNGIVYSSHIYPWKRDWQRYFLDAAEKYPLFIGEVGAIRAWEDFGFIGPEMRYPLDGWAEDMIALIQKHKLHWTGFSFHPTCGPPAISDWDYTPTSFWGVYVKAALAGKQFELKAMR